ncbi:MAG: hypothetical protein Q9212_004551, partial [Teloschistes hypoglaucus]
MSPIRHRLHPSTRVPRVGNFVQLGIIIVIPWHKVKPPDLLYVVNVSDSVRRAKNLMRGNERVERSRSSASATDEGTVVWSLQKSGAVHLARTSSGDDVGGIDRRSQAEDQDDLRNPVQGPALGDKSGPPPIVSALFADTGRARSRLKPSAVILDPMKSCLAYCADHGIVLVLTMVITATRTITLTKNSRMMAGTVESVRGRRAIAGIRSMTPIALTRTTSAFPPQPRDGAHWGSWIVLADQGLVQGPGVTVAGVDAALPALRRRVCRSPFDPESQVRCDTNDTRMNTRSGCRGQTAFLGTIGRIRWLPSVVSWKHGVITVWIAGTPAIYMIAGEDHSSRLLVGRFEPYGGTLQDWSEG